MSYSDSIGIIFPYSLLSASKFQGFLIEVGKRSSHDQITGHIPYSV